MESVPFLPILHPVTPKSAFKVKKAHLELAMSTMPQLPQILGCLSLSVTVIFVSGSLQSTISYFVNFEALL